jgi:hypothetical protein
MPDFFGDSSLLCYSNVDNCQNYFCFPEDYTLVAKVIDAYDGDTIICGIISPLTGQLCKMSVRLNGIDTPEIAGGRPVEKEAALAVRAAVVECSGVKDAFRSRNDRAAIQEALGRNTGNLVILKARRSVDKKGCTTFDAFGRLIADIYPLYPNQFVLRRDASQPGESLSNFLTRLRLARPYSCKQQRESWTDEQLSEISKYMEDSN